MFQYAGHTFYQRIIHKYQVHLIIFPEIFQLHSTILFIQCIALNIILYRLVLIIIIIKYEIVKRVISLCSCSLIYPSNGKWMDISVGLCRPGNSPIIIIIVRGLMGTTGPSSIVKPWDLFGAHFVSFKFTIICSPSSSVSLAYFIHGVPMRVYFGNKG